MPSLTVKNIPEELYEMLKSAAEQHHRSMNSGLIYCLETVLKLGKISVMERIRAVREVRPRIPADAVTREEILDAINKGRL